MLKTIINYDNTDNSKFPNPIIQMTQSEITNAKGLMCDLLPCLMMFMC